MIDGNESCDDWNEEREDGCDEQCQIETGYEVETRDGYGDSEMRVICGDGIGISPFTCDEGEVSRGCDAECQESIDHYNCS